jgi:glucose/mannose transport system permease protein
MSAAPRARRRGLAIRAPRLATLLLVVFVFLIPVYVLIITSFKTLSEADPSTAWNLPKPRSARGWPDEATRGLPGDRRTRLGVSGRLTIEFPSASSATNRGLREPSHLKGAACASLI